MLPVLTVHFQSSVRRSASIPPASTGAGKTREVKVQFWYCCSFLRVDGRMARDHHHCIIERALHDSPLVAAARPSPGVTPPGGREMARADRGRSCAGLAARSLCQVHPKCAWPCAHRLSRTRCARRSCSGSSGSSHEPCQSGRATGRDQESTQTVASHCNRPSAGNSSSISNS